MGKYVVKLNGLFVNKPTLELSYAGNQVKMECGVTSFLTVRMYITGKMWRNSQAYMSFP